MEVNIWLFAAFYVLVAIYFATKFETILKKENINVQSGAINLIAMFWVLWIIPYIIFILNERIKDK